MQFRVHACVHACKNIFMHAACMKHACCMHAQFRRDDTYGIDWDGPLPCNQWSGTDDGNIDIPPVMCPIQGSDYDRLKTEGGG